MSSKNRGGIVDVDDELTFELDDIIDIDDTDSTQD